MQAGRKRNIQSKMKGCLNLDNKLTDIYLPRKCDYTDKVITSKDKSSIQLSVCDFNADGTINLGKSNIITIGGLVRFTGESDHAVQKIMKEKGLM